VETDIAGQMKVSQHRQKLQTAIRRRVYNNALAGGQSQVFDDLDIIETYERREYLEALAVS
jgi:hypothetical protein